MKKIDVSDYILKEYKRALLDYDIARTLGDAIMEDRAKRDFMRLSNMAAELVSFKFAESLRNLHSRY